MRIAIVAESFLPRVDGVSRSVSALLGHCRRTGHEALVIAPGHGPHESAATVESENARTKIDATLPEMPMF